MSVWWAIGAALLTLAAVFAWALCATSARTPEASDLQPEVPPHPRIRLVPRPEPTAQVIDLEAHRRRHHPSTQTIHRGPAA